MAPRRTAADQLAARYSECMPQDLADLYASLFQHVVWLHTNWKTFRDLFADGEETVGLLNDTAPFFFRQIGMALRREAFLGICRLADPPGGGQRQNLCLERAVDEVRRGGDSELAELLAAKVARLRELAAPIQRVRHKILAHNDLNVALNRLAEPIEGVRLAVVDESLTLVADFMDTVQGEYCDSGPNLTWAAEAGRGTDHLLTALEKAR